MAISRIGGRALKANLERDSNLAFNTTTLVVDYTNGRIGVGTASPSQTLDITGSANISTALTVGTQLDVDGLQLKDNNITTTRSNDNLILDASGTGKIKLLGDLVINDGLAISAILDEDSFSTDSATALATQQSIKAYVDAAATPNGMQVQLGTSTDSSVVDGAIQSLTTTTYVTNAIDELNEGLENVRADTFVKSTTFTANTTSGPAGTSVTLTITSVGNPNRYDITWGDGNSTTGTTDSTPTHTYSSNSGSPFDVTVRAYNNGGSGTGSEASLTRTDYITIYTATPVVGFGFYRASSGGSVLSGNDIYVVEGNSLYMANTTTNIGGATVDYTMNWGDGSSNDSIANDSAAGGTAGARLSHTWGAGTHSGTGQDTTTLTLNNHSTAAPADIPANGTVSLKVYDDAPSAPNHLGSKTIAMNATTGISPKLCSGFSEHVSGSPTVAAGDTVNRITTVDPVRTASQSTFCYNAAAGTLTAYVNGSADGAITLSGSDNSGTTSSCTIESESDYNLLDATGAATSFASSIYYPSLYSGFKAIVSKANSGFSVGVNSLQLQHTLGNTNVLEFVKEEVTSVPTISGAGTLTEGTAGTKLYISGIPYYSDSGTAPSLNLAGVTATILTGQCYSDVSNPVEVEADSRLEGSVGSAIDDLDFTYANIDGASTMLASGIPKVNIGVAGAYTLGTLTVPVTTSGSAKTVNEIKIRARNCNGIGSYNTSSTTKIQVYNAATSGFDKEDGGIAVADALGSTHDDDAKRIFDFSAATTNTPTFNGATNFYTNSVYSESSDPGVAGTKEATVRFGVIKYDVTNWSSGYLPAGPNRSGDTGTQYFTFAFRRATVANFDINITSSGIAGLWIAAPGTGIDDSSGLNGWLQADTAYGGSGQPGSDTGNGGNGSNGCAFNSGDRIVASTSLSGDYTMTLGTENLSNATANVALVRIALTSGQSVTALSIS